MRTMKQLQKYLTGTGCSAIKYKDGTIGIYMGKEQRYTKTEVHSVKDAVQVFKNWGVIA